MAIETLYRGNPTWLPGVSQNPGGRPKRLIRRMEEVLSKAAVDPMAELLKLLGDVDITKAQRLKAWIDLLPYIYPKAKDDATAADEVRDALAAMTKEQLIERMESDLLRLKNSG